nr:hypothetical protein [Microbacterium agarici]
MTKGESRNVGIVHEIAADAGFRDKGAKGHGVTRVGLGTYHVRPCKPGIDNVERLVACQWILKDGRVRADSQKRKNAHPGQTESRGTGKRGIEPRFRFVVMT